jgi:DNA polymerase-3 subunit alpha
LNEYYELIKEDKLIFVEGRVQLDEFTGGNSMLAAKIFELITIQSSKAQLLRISLNNKSSAEDLKRLLKPYCNGSFGHEIKKCRVKVEYQNQEGKVELLLGPEWAVALHEDLISGLVESFQDDNVKILYN